LATDGGSGQTDFPSFMVFGKDISAHFKSDIDHQFACNTMKFVQKFIPGLTPDLFNFIKKMNYIETKMSFNNIDELEGAVKKDMNNDMWSTLNEGKESMFEEVKPFVQCLDDFRLFFILKDQAYLSLEFKAPGLSSYLKYFVPDEEEEASV